MAELRGQALIDSLFGNDLRGQSLLEELEKKINVKELLACLVNYNLD